MENITPDFLRSRLRYEPDTGRLFWKPRTAEHFEGGLVSAQTKANRFNGHFAGREAFTAKSDGYHIGNLGGQMLKAHRVAWAIYYGEWPQNHIDHINRDRGDNRIANLRDATRHENNRNFPSAKGSSSRFVGVHRKRNKWCAQIKIDGKSTHIGTFDTEAEAANAYREKAKSVWG